METDTGLVYYQNELQIWWSDTNDSVQLTNENRPAPPNNEFTFVRYAEDVSGHGAEQTSRVVLLADCAKDTISYTAWPTTEYTITTEVEITPGESYASANPDSCDPLEFHKFADDNSFVSSFDQETGTATLKTDDNCLGNWYPSYQEHAFRIRTFNAENFMRPDDESSSHEVKYWDEENFTLNTSVV